ncbi:adenine phosphoribosyltransferase [Allobranchiibius sp. GilTou38]|uniref:adenine phosphoribosyltransferase n=1 Tax=Allobranchiibius sp. GilTou38 TaxID=2815210 RepID=UPI001AA15C96|nr:adenine phosphoribosyltransferase [Allobranchiibius sp. GilTou38]MBO1766323.1 adenine phosphoribosyltransferase [Allobranchiibius sp. GilTou38]
MPVDIGQVLREHTREIPDFPKPGIAFKDLTPLFADAPAFQQVVDDIAERFRGHVDAVAGVEARGFIIGPPVALALGLPFVAVRKAGKLPGETLSQEYDLEYGSATIEISTDAVGAGDRVLVIDDVLATGGTAAAACALLERTGAKVTGIQMLMELAFLHGRDALGERDVHVLVSVDDD